MITFGLTGGICCGKSTVTKTFRAHNIPIVDADVVARQVVKPGTSGLAFLVETFGKDCLSADGTLNRIALGNRVFGNTEAMRQLNHIMMPLITAESDRQLTELRKAGNILVGYDAALIVEHGRADQFRPLIVVSCPPEIQLTRLMKRNGLTREQAIARIASQTPVADKVKLADFVVDTSGSVENSTEQTKDIISALNARLKELISDEKA